MEKPDSIQTRLGTALDAALLAEMGARTFSAAFAEANTPENMAAYLAANFGPAIQAAELADPRIFFLIAEIDGSPSGYAKLQDSPVPEGIGGVRPLELARLYSVPERIGRGTGSALMQAALDEAARRGYDTLWLGVWEYNLKAREFYRKWGFVDAGTHIFVLGDEVQTDYHMQRLVE